MLFDKLKDYIDVPQQVGYYDIMFIQPGTVIMK